jgi:phenylpropionate dioxygenase-like ring-hydroxylating dioxygenase large terminal subunit
MRSEKQMELRQYPRENRIFHDPALFEEELERIFSNGWLCVGADDQLPRPKTWFVYEDVERSLLLTRTESGDVRAFVNACTHRGTRLCKAAGAGRQLQCPYHGWTYDLSGKLLGVPRRAGCAPFADGDYALRSLPVEQVGRMLFVNPTGRPLPPAREALGPMAAKLEALGQELTTPIAEHRYDIAANWKLVVSGMIEDYHVPFVHRWTLHPGRKSASESTLLERGHSSYELSIDPGALVRRLVALIGGRRPPPKHSSYLVFPNFVQNLVLNVATVNLFIPTAQDRTLLVARLYDTSPARARWSPLGWIQRIQWLISRVFSHRVYLEDQWVVEEAQRGTRAGSELRRGPPHAEEARVEHFLREVATRTDRRY